VFNQKTNAFEFRPGPVFVNILLTDEINRATPRPQAALLEAMQDLGSQPTRLISVDGKVLLATVAVKQADKAMQEQLKARLKHLGFRLGLLTNFHGTELQVIPVKV